MALFETPVAHAANYNQNPYSAPEFEDEWATPEANPYGTPEYESEWAMQEANHYNNAYSTPEYENEWATPEANPYGTPEYEWEMPMANAYDNREMAANPYGSPEYEWETPSANPYGNPEYEYEAELWNRIKKLAKKYAPIVVGNLVKSLPIPGASALGSFATNLTSQLVKEGEMEATQMEAELFGMDEAVAEVANTEVAYEAALTEFLATQAAEATNEAEAQAAIGAALPITIKAMGGSKALRSVTPILSQANAAVAETLVKQGPVGKRLLTLMPTIHRRAIATLKAAARSGQPITGVMAIKAMAAASHQVLGNPQKVQQAMELNGALRKLTAPPSPRRAPAGMM